jgi:hypothetical protein
MRTVRSLLAGFVMLALAFSSAPAAHAADPVVGFTVTGASGVTVEFCAWNGTGYQCDGTNEAFPTNNVAYSQPQSELVAGTRYAVRATKSGYWTLWWHQSGASPTAATSAAGDYFTAGSSDVSLGTFAMTKRLTISGSVTSAGADLGGIVIGIYGDAIAAASRITSSSTASGDGTDKILGEFDLTIPYGATGDYLLGLYDPNGVYAARTMPVTFGSSNLVVDPTLSLAGNTATVTGTVALEGSDDAAGVTVDTYLWTGSAWAPVDSADSDSDGSFSLSVDNNRTFTLKFTKAGFTSTWLGGGSSAPSSPAADNSRVASGIVPLATTTLPTRASAFGKVAGQDLSVCTQHTLAQTGSFNAAPLDLGFSINLYGVSGSRLYVTDKGFAYLSDTEVTSLAERVTVPDLDTWRGVPVVAPLWFDADLSGAAADSVTYGVSGGRACVRWNDLGHYSGDDSVPNTFQLILDSKTGETNRSAGDVDLTFNYDQVLWSGASVAGFTAGDKVAGHFWVYPWSTASAYDSGDHPMIANSVGSSVNGRYSFEIRNALINTSVPSISGPAAPGKTLTASTGSWLPSPDSYSYQWFLSGAAISGATASTYLVVAGDVGKQLSVAVTANRTGLSPVTANSGSVTVLNAFTTTPKPTISGTVKVGSTLTAKPGTWSPTATLSYQWYRGATPIAAATSYKYKVALADVGQALSVRVTGAKTGYLSVTSASSATKTVPKVAMKAATPKISGTTKVGKTLKFSRGSWTSGVTFTYQWYRSGKAISGATRTTYKLTSADRGKTIKVKVTGTKTGYVTTSKASKSTKKIR